MGKDDFKCDVCGEYAPAHAADCLIVLENKRKAERARRPHKPVSRG